MSTTSKILVTLSVIAAVVVVVVWLGGGSDQSPIQPPSPEPETEPAPVTTNTSAFFTRPGTKVARPANVVAVEPPLTNSNLITDWEDRVDQILGDDTEVDEKARKMLELFPNFPESGQVETATHISNLLADEDYEKFGRYLTNVGTPAGVLEVILADALNRPNEIKLPLLLGAARDPANVKAGEAKELLELYLADDYGSLPEPSINRDIRDVERDWKIWEQHIKDWLKENPD